MRSDRLDRRTVALSFDAVDGPLTWRALLELWRTPSGAQAFSEALLAASRLVDSGGGPFRWECPPLSQGALAESYECVVVSDPWLDVPADAVPFREQLATSDTTATFANLSGRSTLVIPTKTNGGRTQVAHLEAFLRTAPDAHIADLWHAVADAVQRRLDTRADTRFWLSTAGGGVAWLHVRLDPTPKYYHHDPYCSVPPLSK